VYRAAEEYEEGKSRRIVMYGPPLERLWNCVTYEGKGRDMRAQSGLLLSWLTLDSVRPDRS